MYRFFWIVALQSLFSGVCAADAEWPGEVVINGVEFVHIPGGAVAYPIPHVNPKTGNPIGRGRREISVVTDGYYLAKYEARARDFLRFMSAGRAQHAAHYEPHPLQTYSGVNDGCSVRRNEKGEFFLVQPAEDLPATHLSWDLANEFAQWMGFRLPTDAEWVRAFRGDDKRTYPWGNEPPDDTYAAFQEGATECNILPVDALPKGQSPYGVFNMAGNVFEYVADWVNTAYLNGLKNGDRNPFANTFHPMPGFDEPVRSLRGGRWASGPGELSIYGNRDSQPPARPFRCYGARFALDETVVKRLLADGTARRIR